MFGKKLAARLILLLLVPILQKGVVICGMVSIYSPSDGKNTEIIKSFAVASKIQCSHHCSLHSSCVGVDTRERSTNGKQICKLLKTAHGAPEMSKAANPEQRSNEVLKLTEKKDPGKVYADCNEALNENFAINGTYSLQPMTGNPDALIIEHVGCLKQGLETYVVMEHDTSERVLRSNQSNRYSWLTYTQSMEEIDILKASSGQCRQYVSYECFNSKLGITSNTLGNSGLFWRGGGSSGDALTYFPTSIYTQDSHGMCSGNDASCCGSAMQECDCDTEPNNQMKTGDRGYFADKNRLPVKGIEFLDVDEQTQKYGYSTLGPLECLV